MNAATKVCTQCGTEYPANARFCEIDGTALRGAAASGDLVGAIVADRYHVLKKLGEGGMGQVYLAEHVKMGRKSALKVMHPGMVKDIDSISRFNREAANASRIAHPNVAAVYDFGETADGIIYLAMEFVDGPPLTSVIELAGALPPKRAADIVRQAAEALAVAHDMGIVHRDLKPDNIMVAKTRDGGDLVKVVDFGIAKAAGNDAQKVTKTGLVVGTPEYMSPEQLAGDKLDGRSDIYSLALVAFNMLTGKLPFPADSAQESMIMRLTDKPKPLAEMRPEVAWPADVQAVMDKALERDAALRYQTATEFGRDLYRVVDRMAETQAAEVGTQILGVPPTRVASESPPSGRAGAGGTVSVPAPIANAPLVTQTAAPPTRKGMIPVIAGIATVVALGGVVAVVKILGKSTPPPLAADTTHNAPAIPSGVTATAPTGTNAKRVLSPDSAKRERTAVPPASNGQTDASPERQLTKLETDVKDSTKAEAVLRSMDGLYAKLQFPNDQARAWYVRYLAYLNRGDTESNRAATCQAIREAMNIATDPDAKKRYSRAAVTCVPSSDPMKTVD